MNMNGTEEPKCSLCKSDGNGILLMCGKCQDDKQIPICRACAMDPMSERMGFYEKNTDEWTCNICVVMNDRKERAKFMEDFDRGTKENAIASAICARYKYAANRT